jgi:hypothetical protein
MVRTVYELLFRSRWYALAWALCMATSAILFTTTGAGAWLTGTKPDPRASEAAREAKFRSWAEDDRRRLSDDQGYDPSSPEVVRDGLPRTDDGANPQYQTVPYTPGDADPADGAASE